MKRLRMTFLNEWLKSSERKPLVIRGARQVGKTWLVRHFAEIHDLMLIELNFEKRIQFASLFNSNDPKQILLNLETIANETIDPKKSLLFLDEIQAAPDLFAKLRWFAEDMPELPLIAAGSLLEFVLEKHSFSMPVGRINYLYLEPLSFEEFLLALDKRSLFDYLSKWQWGMEIPSVIHEQLLKYFKEYIVVGGMPAAVSSWIHQHSLNQINQIHHDLLSTYRDDFAKYSGRLSIERLDEVMMAVPKFLGQKFVYSKVNPSIQIPSIKKSLELLSKARICHIVHGCAANGVPLAAEIQIKNTKVIFLDIGLCSGSLGISLDLLSHTDEISLVNKGDMAEQVVGQLLRTSVPPYIDPSLYYWQREEKGSSAEVDYVIQHRNLVVPVEVKAGSTGSLKSLHLFIGLKGYKLAVRINSDFPSKTDLSIKIHGSENANYTLYSIPFYLIEQLHRLLNNKLESA